ncbi:MAG: pentapeptide repeat-containing protein [Bacteroidota bacterium]
MDKKRIKDCLSIDQFKQAIDLLESLRGLTSEELMEIALFKRTYLSNEKKSRKREISGETYEIEKNRLISRIWSFLDELSQEVKSSYQTKLATWFPSLKMLDSEILVSDLYVSPTYSTYDWSIEPEDGLPENPFVLSHKDIQAKLDEFLLPSDSRQGIMVILGYPGQGKSTLCRKLAHDLLQPPSPSRIPYLVELKNVQTSETDRLIANPLNLILDRLKKIALPDEIEGVLILDGLDELYMKNGLGKEDIYTICNNLSRAIARDHPKAKVIITSRLGYLHLKTLPASDFEILKLDEFDLTQQKIWLDKYKTRQADCVLKEETLVRYWKHKQEKSNDQSIPEMLGQPLTLYLVAKLKINLGQVSAKAAIYQELLAKVIGQRKYENKLHPNLGEIPIRKLREVLREIATEIYLGDQEFITNQEAIKLPVLKVIEKSTSAATVESSLRNLLMSFYFQEKVLEDQDEIEEEVFAIEFLHKSLQEFLVAENIWTQFLNLSEKNVQAFAENTLARFSRRKISLEVLTTVRELARMYAEDKRNEANVLTTWNHCLKAEALSASNDFFPKELQSDRYLTTLTPLEVMGNVSSVFTEVLHGLGNYLDSRRLTLQPTDNNLLGYMSRYGSDDPRNRLSFMFRHYTNENDFSNKKLSNLELFQSTFENVLFNQTTFLNCRISGSRFVRCSFIKATFGLDRMYRVIFEDCTFDEATFQNIRDMEGTHFQNCSMRKVRIDSRINLKRCTFRNIDFEAARLQGVRFYRGLPGGCNYRGAILQGSFLAGDDEGIGEADLSNTNLRNAKTEWADIREVKFIEAEMTGMIMKQSSLVDLDFTGAKGLSFEMFESSSVMHEIKGLPPELEDRLRRERPDMWHEPAWYANWRDRKKNQ